MIEEKEQKDKRQELIDVLSDALKGVKTV